MWRQAKGKRWRQRPGESEEMKRCREKQREAVRIYKERGRGGEREGGVRERGSRKGRRKGREMGGEQ